MEFVEAIFFGLEVMDEVVITAVINGHREGLLAHSSLVSLTRAADYAARQGYAVELLAILDRPDALTVDVFECFQRKSRREMRVQIVDHGDLGYARNDAALIARGQWIAFLDADDFWSENWLLLAAQAARRDRRNIVWHPAANLYFGVSSHVMLHRDMEDDRFKISSLAYTNLWTALCFVSTELLRATPYSKTDLKNNLGYEDWGWNVEIINRGGLHKTIAGTSHAIRTKPISLLTQTNAAQCVPRPTLYFRQMLPAKTPAPHLIEIDA